MNKLLGMLGIAISTIGFWLIVQNILFGFGGLHATATITECRVVEETTSENSSKKIQYYYPTLSFTDAGGKLHTKKFRKTTTAYTKGETLGIIYNPKEPNSITVDSPLSKWWLGFPVLILGLSSILFAIRLS